ncbi:MAG: HAMP domain-containing histidine kinase, partial [Thermoleophilia bacterium]|nr:HAMP domain-containing histidine kinase [Thermoleophilia bacterium]
IIARARDAADASRRLKEANLELERLARELEEAGRAADRQHQEQLEAEREDRRRKDEFLTTVSHELRTPLTSVIGYISLALEGGYDLDPEVAELLEVARRNGGRLGALVEDLLLIAQAQADRLPLRLRPVALGALIDQALEAARPSAAAAGLRITRRLDPVPDTLADPARIGQLLDNLIANAVKYTPAGGEVAVALAERSGRARISVADTGPGIPPDERPRLFDRFYRTRGAVDEGVPGTGLGLSIARAIAEAHGGGIRLDDAPGAGSVFVVDLPLTREKDRAAAAGSPG